MLTTVVLATSSRPFWDMPGSYESFFRSFGKNSRSCRRQLQKLKLDWLPFIDYAVNLLYRNEIGTSRKQFLLLFVFLLNLNVLAFWNTCFWDSLLALFVDRSLISNSFCKKWYVRLRRIFILGLLLGCVISQLRNSAFSKNGAAFTYPCDIPGYIDLTCNIFATVCMCFCAVCN